MRVLIYEKEAYFRKCIVIGESGVEKAPFLLKFTYDISTANHLKAIENDFNFKILNFSHVLY